MSNFSQFALSPAVVRRLAAGGIAEPTPIQEEAIPALLAGRDLIGQARTGSGKTLAYALPLVQRCDPKSRAVGALVLVPTRELAVQVGGVISGVAHELGLRVALLYGGKAMGPQQLALSRGAHIVVATPGRLIDHLHQGTLSLSQVHYLVLDEADEMLDRGFGPDVERIIAQTPSTRQTALFSATTPDWVRKTAARHLRSPQMVLVDPDPEDRPVIDQVVYEMPEEVKPHALRVLLNQQAQGATIVFGRTKHRVKRLALQLQADGYPAAALQGNMSQAARERVIGDFRAGRIAVLLATNVAARGLDIEDVGLVVNYELPETAEWFTHRIGRTGRMGQAGRAVTLLAPADLPQWRQFERTLQQRIPRQVWPLNMTVPLPAVKPAAPSAPATAAKAPARSAPAAAARPPAGSGARPPDRPAHAPAAQQPTPVRRASAAVGSAPAGAGSGRRRRRPRGPARTGVAASV